jgi:hypothetical protein
MCLSLSPEEFVTSEEFRRELYKKPLQRVEVYKVLLIDKKEKTIRTPIQGAPFKLNCLNQFVSNGKTTTPEYEYHYNCYEVTQAIHCYLKKPDCLPSNRIVTRAFGYAQYFVGKLYNHIAFTKIQFDTKDLKQVLKEAFGSTTESEKIENQKSEKLKAIRDYELVIEKIQKEMEQKQKLYNQYFDLVTQRKQELKQLPTNPPLANNKEIQELLNKLYITNTTPASPLITL